MKIVHLSDSHLGWRELHHTDDEGHNLRELDVYDAFAQAIDRVLELEPAVVIHSGDLFEGYHPFSAALGVALDQIERLRAAGIEFVVIAGNHETPRVRAIAHPFSLLERFGVDAVHAEPRRLRFGDLAVTAIPHSNDPEAMAGWIAAAEPDADARFNVLVAHAGLEGLARVGAGEPGAVELPGELLEQVASFDYIALGHLHQLDRPRVNAVFPGSLERLSWGDQARRKGIVEVDLAAEPLDDAFLTVHKIEGRSRKRLPALDASKVDDLTGAITRLAKKRPWRGRSSKSRSPTSASRSTGRSTAAGSARRSSTASTSSSSPSSSRQAPGFRSRPPPRSCATSSPAASPPASRRRSSSAAARPT